MTHTTCTHLDNAAANALCDSFRAAGPARFTAAPAPAAPQITFQRLTALSSQHALSDRKAASRYAVLVDGVVVGEVRTASVESWDSNGRIRTRMRGYVRTWEAHAPGASAYARPLATKWTRADAARHLADNR